MHRRKMLFHHPSYRTGRDRKFDINRKIPLIGKNCLFGLFRQFSQLSSALQPMGIGSKTWTAPTQETHHGSPAWGDGWLAMAADSLRLGPSGIAPRGAAVALDCILVGGESLGDRGNLPHSISWPIHRHNRTEEGSLGSEEWHLPNIPSQRQLGVRWVERPPRSGWLLR